MFDLFPIHGGVCAPEGFSADGIAAGLKKEGKLDVAFVHSLFPAKVSALFTTNRFAAAPIRYFQGLGEVFDCNFVLINAKNANAMTGVEGIEDIEWLMERLKHRFPSLINPVMSSTGVIGVRLPKEKIEASLGEIVLGKKEGARAAQAIMTTDAFSKEVAFKVELSDGRSFCIGAMAKGAGMIDPAMATMLCFITTDADVPENRMKELLQKAAHTTFNAISVDGDTSTNDTVMLFSNKASGVYEEGAFLMALERVMHKLATDVARDGEGAKKLVAFEVSGAASEEEAIKAAKALTTSLLVKTAIFGEDPNWGRIASTIGSSGVECDENRLRISFGEVLVYDRGAILFDKTIEEKAASVMRQESFKIHCDLGIGRGKFTAYGCDLGYEYVKINADYRT